MQRESHLRVAASAICLTPMALAAAGCRKNDQSAVAQSGKDARDITTLWWIMLVGSVVVLAVVLVLVAAVLLRRRAERGAPDLEPHSRLGTWVPVVGGILVPSLVLAGLF